jgi:hypothetical protein
METSMTDLTPVSASSLELVLNAVKGFIKLDKAKEITLVKQADGTWLIKGKK